ncbi:FIST N-terminal domain-containing protein, partial [Tritonibacter sp. SIMBA_163]|uniref:FIST N-terminal domain-containing protein n=1 Tax=Tritonibacter sp. SIMBA_163 TaxID=3080868 RepID=UPI0039804D6F
NDLLEGLDFAYPNGKKVGGLASAMAMGMQTGLFFETATEERVALVKEGIVGVALSGNIEMDTIVAQGCRPVGPQYQIVQGER